MKKCKHCGLVKLLSEFTVRKTGEAAGNPLAWCKSCTSKDVAHRAMKKKAKRYGLSLKQYRRLRSTREGRLKLRVISGEKLNEKRCTRCGFVKPIGEFYFRHGIQVGRGSISACKLCSGKICAAQNRARRLERVYKITESDYERMVRSQNGLCAICKRPPKTKRLNIDHDHDTGRVRGLLCGMCNSALGHFEKNKDNVTKYLGIWYVQPCEVDIHEGTEDGRYEDAI